MKSRALVITIIGLPLAGLIAGILLGAFYEQQKASVPLIGEVQTFEASYRRWKISAEQQGHREKLILSLAYIKGLSPEFSDAHGKATFDLVNGSLSVDIVGLSENRDFEVWLVHNRPGPGRSVKPEPGDGMIRVGELTHQNGRAVLQKFLDGGVLAEFKLDLLVVVPRGESPTSHGFLFAAPNVFQKRYYAERQAPLRLEARLNDKDNLEGSAALAVLAPFRFLVPTMAYADKGGMPHFADLIARGEKLFFEEKFKGNGRTCGSCHPAENNFTIDPAFIATLSPKDPLFVAEFNKDLNSERNGGRHFEIPQMMRQFGLILENVDGFDDLTSKFVMRGVPHTFAQGLSITPAPFDGTSSLVLHRTGWSGDGSPGGGTLREFAIGAVAQHFTRTLNRIPGVDFRLPTDAELDAMEAFMLSLGRQSEIELSTLQLSDADAKVGLELFNDAGPDGGRCSLCHFNAGANHGIAIPSVALGTQNANFNTGVENASHPAGQHGALRPRDGGFGRSETIEGFGNGTFNTPSLIEAADTPPFFHNNVVETVEDAVAFYSGEAFNLSPSGLLVPINLTSNQANQVAAFLRVINALENIRSSEAKLLSAQQANIRLPQLKKLFVLTMADINDAVRVLKQSPLGSGGLHPTAQTYLEEAKEHCQIAQAHKSKQERNIRINAALTALARAKGEMIP